MDYYMGKTVIISEAEYKRLKKLERVIGNWLKALSEALKMCELEG